MRRHLLTLALASCFAARASALDLVLGAESDMRFDDNIYGTQHNTVSDFLWTLGPTIELSEDTHTLSGNLNVRPTYQLYFDENRLRGFNYDADGQLEWQPSERTSLTLTDTFLRDRTLRGFQPGSIGPSPSPGGTPSPTPAVAAGREPFLRNVSQLSISHRTSPQGTLQLSTNYAFWDFSRPTRIDQAGLAGALQYTRLIDSRTRLGGGLSYSRQIFDYAGSSNRHTDYFNASFSVSYVPAETFFVRASAGPTLVRQQQIQNVLPNNVVRSQLIPRDSTGIPRVGIPGTCPLLASGDPYLGSSCTLVSFPLVGFLRLSDPIPLIGPAPSLSGPRNSFTYFADLAIDKQWELSRLSLSYRRDQGSSSAINYSTIADTIEVQANLQLTRELIVYLNTAWESRVQTGRSLSAPFVTVLGTLPATPTLPAVNNLVPIGLAANPIRAATLRHRIRSLSASLSGEYLLSEELRLEALVGWTDQNATRGSGYEPMSDVFVRIGLNFRYEPFRW